MSFPLLRGSWISGPLCGGEREGKREGRDRRAGRKTSPK